MEPWTKDAGELVQNSNFTDVGVTIVGGGISGMCMAIKLIEKGIHNFVILEENSGFGGTWRENKYPGCCCDILSHLYCFSFEQNPDWSRLYPGQEEILKYLSRVARKYNIDQYARFASTVQAAHWDEKINRWKVTVHVLNNKEAQYGDNYTITTDFLISAVGQLNVPSFPDLPGLGAFKGNVMHSARWNSTYDFRGKRVGIVGNGATAVQIVPELTKVASNVTIFQRTPNWIVPRQDAPVSGLKKYVYRNIPWILQRVRADIMDGREAYFQSFTQRHSVESETMKGFCIQYIKSQLADRPDLWESLTPEYPLGCKRVLLSDDYYPALLQPHVSLETRPIYRITKEGVSFDDALDTTIKLDVIIMATGFRTQDFLHKIAVTGLEKETLSETWKNGARALYGITVEKMPNFAMLYGPNTNLGHNSIILMIEAQSTYIASLAAEVMKSGTPGKRLVVTPNIERVHSFNEKLQKDLALSSFADPRCTSWYKRKEGLVTNNWSGPVMEYQKQVAEIDWSDFDLTGPMADYLQSRKTNIGRVVEETLISYRSLSLCGAILLTIVGVFLV